MFILNFPVLLTYKTLRNRWWLCYTLPQKSGGVLCYTLRTVCMSIHQSVCPSVRASFPDSNLGSFWPIFFIFAGVFWDCRWAKFVYKQQSYGPWLMCFSSISVYALIYTRSLLYLLMHIIFGQFLTELWPLIDVRILFMLNILWINLWILIKFCICIDIDMIEIWRIEQYFSFIFNRVDWCRNSFMLNILCTKWWILIKFCKCIDTDKM